MSRTRPLSPHLQVYRPMYTMVLSISHRISGVFQSVGLLLLAAWLVAAAAGEPAYQRAAGWFALPWVKLMLIGWLAAFWYHFFAGFRHLAWDTGKGLDKASARRSGAWVVVLAVLATGVCLWAALPLLGAGA